MINVTFILCNQKIVKDIETSLGWITFLENFFVEHFRDFAIKGFKFWSGLVFFLQVQYQKQMNVILHQESSFFEDSFFRLIYKAKPTLSPLLHHCDFFSFRVLESFFL